MVKIFILSEPLHIVEYPSTSFGRLQKQQFCLNMEIFYTGHYKYNRKILYYLGLWPFFLKKNGKYYFAGVVSIFTVFVPIVINSLRHPTIETVLYLLVPALTSVAMGTKAFNTKLHQRQFYDLMCTIENDRNRLHQKEEKEIMDDYALQGKKFTMVYSAFVWGTVSSFAFLPFLNQFLDIILPLNESRPRQLMLVQDYGVDPETYFYYIYMHQTATAFLFVTLAVGVDSFVNLLLLHPCSLFAVVAYRLKHLVPVKFNGQIVTDVPIEYDEPFWILRGCVSLHQHALSYADAVTSKHATSYLIQMVSNMLIISITGFEVVITEGDLLTSLRFVLFTIGATGHLFVNSFTGQIILNHSLRVRETVYVNPVWYELSKRSRFIIWVMMMRSTVPSALCGGKFVVLGMSNFASVLQVSMSYFTLFTSIR